MFSCSEDVCIVLNERESRKAELAERLMQRLIALGLCAVRIPPRPGLAQVIKARGPRVLITDYVLSDYGTGLDLLSETAPSSAKFLFWTDEPSVRTAVAAMKLGAEDYFQIDSPASLERVAEAARRLSRTQTPAVVGSKPGIVASSPAFQRALKHAQAALKQTRVLVLFGEAGSGRSTTAEFVHQQLLFSGAYCEYSCFLHKDLNLASLEKQGSEATLTIEHAEELPDFREAFESIRALRSRLIVATTSRSVAAAAREFFRCEQVAVPPLRERPEDVLPLLRRSALLVSEHLASAPISQRLLDEVQSLDWPGNVREFCSCSLDAFAGQAARKARRFNEEEFAAGLKAAKARWESGQKGGLP